MVDLVCKLVGRGHPTTVSTIQLVLYWHFHGIPETFYAKESSIIYGAFCHISRCWMRPPWSPNDRLLGWIIRACPGVAHQTHSRVQPYLNEALGEATKQPAPKAPSITWIFTGHKPLILVRGSMCWCPLWHMPLTILALCLWLPWTK
jgi:hypothetical protein